MFSDWWDVKEFWKSSRKIGGSPELNYRHQRGPKGCAVGLRTLVRPHKMWLQKDRHKGAKQAEYLARSKRYHVFKPWGELRIRETCSVITAEHARFDASCTCQSWCQDTLDKNGGGGVAGNMLIALQGIKEQSKEIFLNQTRAQLEMVQHSKLAKAI